MSAPTLAPKPLPNGGKPVRPLWELLVLAGPTVAQMLSYTLMQFTDTVMLSRVGDLEALAAANAGGLAHALTALGFGAMWLVNTLVSQSFGRGDHQGCGKYLWQGVWLSVIFGVIVGPLAFLGGPVMTLLDHEPELVRLESIFLYIVLPFTIVKLVGAAGGQFLLAIGRPNRTLLAALFGVGVNIVANYILIFGNLGSPAFGLVGAAWGTVIGQLAEAILIWVFILSPKVFHAFGVADWKPRAQPFYRLVKLGLPSGMQMTADVTAWTLFSFGVMAEFGTKVMTANAYMFRYAFISFLPAFGISAAVTTLVGRYIGAGDPETAAKRAHLGFAVGGGYMLSCGLVFLLFGRQLIGVFSDDPEILRLGTQLMVILAIYQLFDAMYINYLGALRGAGDTFWPSLVTIVLCWGVMLGVGWTVAIYLPQFGQVGPWAVTVLYGTLLGAFMLWRFQRGGWRKLGRADGLHN